MSKKLWQPSIIVKKNSNLFAYENYISKKLKIKFNRNYKKLLNWSIKNSPEFWSRFWDFSKIKGFKSNKNFSKSKTFYRNLFLPGSRLNFGENLLSKNNNEKAVTFISENGFREERSWRQLNLNTNKISKFLKKINIKKGDRVAAYMPNTIETVEAFIATTSLGGIWSSCSPDFGSKGVIERFSQINPKVLFITDQYFYNGKKIDILNRLPEILKLIPSIKSVVISNYPGKKFIKNKHIYIYKTEKYNTMSKYSNFDLRSFLAEGKKAKEENIEETAPGFEHDCAAHVVHETYGYGVCIEGKHTLVENENGGHEVTHYDVFFKNGETKENIPVNELKVITSESHSHGKSKKKNEEALEEDNVEESEKLTKEETFKKEIKDILDS